MRERDSRHLSLLLLEEMPEATSAQTTFFKAADEATPKPLDQAPAEFTWRDYTIFLLTVAAQIEHSLMVQYLYAAFSLGGPQVPLRYQDDVAAWRQMILGIAKEEMGHLATVQNVLRFLGAPLALDREDYPWDVALAPYPFILEPLSRASLAKYVVAESPEQWPSGVSAAERREIEKLATGSGTRPINRVGKLFDKIIEILANEDRLPTSMLHPGSYSSQATWDEWGRGYGKGARGSSIAGTTKTPDVLIMRVASRSEALAALRAVAAQGEAPSEAGADDEEASHFHRFLTIYRSFPADGAWEPAVDTPTNPVAPGLGAGNGQTPIKDPEAGLWANLFNLRYRMLLTYLGHTYSVPRTGVGERRGPIINRMFAEMYNLRAIASLLTRMPLGGEGDQRAGPPFQMPYSLQLPETEAGYWSLHLDLLEASANLLAEASGREGPTGDYARSLSALDEGARHEFRLYAEADAVRTGAVTIKGSR